MNLLDNECNTFLNGIVHSACECGETIRIELRADPERTCRSDLVRPHYNDSGNAETIMTCRSCGELVSHTVPEAQFHRASQLVNLSHLHMIF